VMYTGPGMHDLDTRHFDFLWVWWFEIINAGSPVWSSSTLDLVCFPPMHRNDSFGFVDPKDVLCGCHIIPAFTKGKRQVNEVGISRCAKDGKDYNFYYVSRYVLWFGHDDIPTLCLGFLCRICVCTTIGDWGSVISMRISL
jgi:hypothetical protein